MIPSLIILASLIVTGLVLYIHHRLTGGDDATTPTEPDEASIVTADNQPAPHGDFCCGQHLICEKPREYDPSADYFDDEELDAYAGRAGDMYSEAETDDFREVLDTLAEGEALEWSHALQRRGINLPDDLRDELLLLISEARAPKAV